MTSTNQLPLHPEPNFWVQDAADTAFRLSYSHLNTAALLPAVGVLQLGLSRLDEGKLGGSPPRWHWINGKGGVALGGTGDAEEGEGTPLTSLQVTIGQDTAGIESAAQVGIATMVYRDWGHPAVTPGLKPGAKCKIVLRNQRGEEVQYGHMFIGWVENVAVRTDKRTGHYWTTITAVDIVRELQQQPEFRHDQAIEAGVLHRADAHTAGVLERAGTKLSGWSRWPTNPTLETSWASAPPAGWLDMIATSIGSRWFAVHHSLAGFTTPVAMISQGEILHEYSDVEDTRLLDVTESFDTSDIINEIVIKNHAWSADGQDKTNERTYRDVTSVATHGPRRAEIETIINEGNNGAAVDVIGQQLTRTDSNLGTVIRSITVDDWRDKPMWLGYSLAVTWRGTRYVAQVIGIDHQVTIVNDPNDPFRIRTTYHLRHPKK